MVKRSRLSVATSLLRTLTSLLFSKKDACLALLRILLTIWLMDLFQCMILNFSSARLESQRLKSSQIHLRTKIYLSSLPPTTWKFMVIREAVHLCKLKWRKPSEVRTKISWSTSSQPRTPLKTNSTWTSLLARSWSGRSLLRTHPQKMSLNSSRWSTRRGNHQLSPTCNYKRYW